MKTNKIITFISIRIILLFTVAIMMTFLPDLLRGFFGDTKHICTIGQYGCTTHSEFNIDELWNWGARHYWYFWMMFILFALQVVSLVAYIVDLVDPPTNT